jgi:SAM-dependent methyltransferase
MQRSLWLDVWLPYQLHRFVPRGAGRLREQIEQKRSDSRPLCMNLRRLRRKVQTIGTRSVGSSRWLNYAVDHSYNDEETARKEGFVKGFLDAHRLRRVLDLGCNTGRFAEWAAARGATVVAVDTDVACVDRLYCRSRDNRWNILPFVMDIANPSPGIGFRNIERAPFMNRASFDCVFALALVHHLLVTARLPLDSIRDLFADLTTSYLIVEFVEPQDPMFVSLLGAREDLYRDLTLDAFLDVFEQRFEIISQAPITPHRTLFRLRKRA